MMTDTKLLCAGACGTVVAALCCFTPLLVVLLGAAGFGAWLGWADYVVMPALIGFVLLGGCAINHARRTPHDAAGAPGSKERDAMG